MGSVYEATHLISRRSLALKVFDPEVSQDIANRERFMREASAPAQIGHPGIVEVIDAGFDATKGSLFVAMELLHGETFRVRIETLKASRTDAREEDALRIFEALLEPLAAAHAKGIVHRDIKPENVFLQRMPSGVEAVRVLDFGIARDVASPTPSVTQTGVAMGTPQYMAPEQGMSARQASFPADVWAMGCVLYEIFTGRIPFAAESLGLMIAAAVLEPHKPVTHYAPSVAPEFAALIDACLAKDPLARPANAGALLQAFREARRGASAAGARREGAATLDLHTPVATLPSAPSPVEASAASPPPASPLAATVVLGAAAFSPATTPSPIPATAAPRAVKPPTPEPVATPEAPRSNIALLGALATVLVTVVACCGLSGASMFVWWCFGAERITGVLEAGDRTFEHGYFDDHRIIAEQGETLDITLESSAFDPILYVTGPNDFHAENDDANGYDSHLVIPNAQAGEYVIQVAGFQPNSAGEYALTIVHE